MVSAVWTHSETRVCGVSRRRTDETYSLVLGFRLSFARVFLMTKIVSEKNELQQWTTTG